ncbi:MAG: nuclease-related domain-containing protein [Candidatus Microthrix subdominans]
MVQKIKAWRYQRRYSTERAGESGRVFAAERLQAFVRANAVRLAVTLAVGTTFGALVFLLPSRFDAVKGFAFGAWCAFVFGMAYHWCMIASGAAQSMMGMQGERWTDEALRSLRKRGWRVVNHLTLKQGDIDHVAIGPSGLMVIESKWTSSPMVLDGTDAWVANWTYQARRNTDDVKRFIGWGAKADAPISPLLVIWGPQVRPAMDELYRAGNGVTVIAGSDLRQALNELEDEQTDRDEVERAFRKLAEHSRHSSGRLATLRIGMARRVRSNAGASRCVRGQQSRIAQGCVTGLMHPSPYTTQRNAGPTYRSRRIWLTRAACRFRWLRSGTFVASTAASA